MLLLLTQVSTAEQSIPQGYGAALLKMLVALVVVCALAYLVLRAARRHLSGDRRPGKLLKVVDRCPLSGRQSLWVVQVKERCFLIGSSDGALTKLAELELDLDDHEDSRASFLEVLKGKGRGGPGDPT